MKRNLRFYFALMFARGTALVLKLIGRKGTSMPGSWAIILCPDFIGHMPKPEKIIGITGTNGKTTVANMIEDVLEDNGIDFICNRSGTNVHTGIASTLIANSRFFGKPKHKLAVFEMDERSAPNFFPYMQPDILLCTNIFRDSYKRNAHAEFILDVLNREIPKGTRLVLNADENHHSGSDGRFQLASDSHGGLFHSLYYNSHLFVTARILRPCLPQIYQLYNAFATQRV